LSVDLGIKRISRLNDLLVAADWAEKAQNDLFLLPRSGKDASTTAPDRLSDDNTLVVILFYIGLRLEVAARAWFLAAR
jgi:hypothetical protein